MPVLTYQGMAEDRVDRTVDMFTLDFWSAGWSQNSTARVDPTRAAETADSPLPRTGVTLEFLKFRHSRRSSRTHAESRSQGIFENLY